MSNQIIYLTGTINWAKTRKPDEKYEVYTLDLHLDEEGFKKFKDSGLGLKVRESEQGDYIKVRRPTTKTIKGEVQEMGPPKVYLVKDNGEAGEDYVPFEGNIGNGSKGIVKLRVYDGKRGKGHELVAVSVTELVEYLGDEGEGEFPF